MTLKQENETLRSALKTAIIALDDWTHLYAPEFCDEERVNQAQIRLSEHGTLYYIADVVTQCRDALKETNDMFNVKDTVEFHSTGDHALDGKIGIVEGFYADKDFLIVVFAHPHPVGYNSAIVITKHCLKKV